MSERLGLELSALAAGLEISSKMTAFPATVQSVELTMVPLTLGLPVHLKAGHPLDFFVAPTLSVVNYTGVETLIDGSHVASGVDVDTDIGIGAALGLDVPLGRGKWAFSTGLRYMETKAEDREIDPVIVTIGFAHRF